MSTTGCESDRATIRLHVWGSHSSLPTLDPTSLYAASLLRHSLSARQDSDKRTNYSFELVSASTTLASVPLVEIIQPCGEILVLDQLSQIVQFCSNEIGLNVPQDGKTAARLTALHALLDDELLDIVLHSLFSLPDNYRAVTAPSYASIGGVKSSFWSLHSSIPSRLRTLVQERLSSPSVGLWGIGGQEVEKQKREAQELSRRAGIPQGHRGLDDEMKSKTRDEFERNRVSAKASQVLDVLAAALDDSYDYLLGQTAPTALDLHLFAYLAPLLSCSPELPIATIPSLLKSKYAGLVRHTDRIAQLLWPLDDDDDKSSWPTWTDATKTIATTTTSSSSPLSSSTSFPSSLWESISNLVGILSTSAPSASTGSKASATTYNSTNSNDRRDDVGSSSGTKSTRPPLSKEEKRLRWGRAIWICTALLGIVGYTFASGIPIIPTTLTTFSKVKEETTCPRVRHIVSGTFNSENLYLLSFDTLTKSLSITAEIEGQGPHQFLALGRTSSGARTVYATTWADRKSLSAWRVSEDFTHLEYLNTVDITATSSYVHVQPPPYYTLTSPCYGNPSIGPTKHLYSAGGPTGELHSICSETGKILSKLQEFVFLSKDQPLSSADKSRKALRYGAHSFDVSISNYAYVADLGSNSILIYQPINNNNLSSLSFQQVAIQSAPRLLDCPRHVIPSPDGRFFFSVNEHSSFVDVFSISSSSSSSSPVKTKYLQSLDILPPKLFQNRTQFRGDTLRFSSDARFLFASTRGKTSQNHGWITVFSLPPDLTSSSSLDILPIQYFETRTSGGKANAIEFASPSSVDNDIDWIVLTDDQLGYIDILEWNGNLLSSVSFIKLPPLTLSEPFENQGASHAIWID